MPSFEKINRQWAWGFVGFGGVEGLTGFRRGRRRGRQFGRFACGFTPACGSEDGPSVRPLSWGFAPGCDGARRWRWRASALIGVRWAAGRRIGGGGRAGRPMSTSQNRDMWTRVLAGNGRSGTEPEQRQAQKQIHWGGRLETDVGWAGWSRRSHDDPHLIEIDGEMGHPGYIPRSRYGAPGLHLKIEIWGTRLNLPIEI